MYLEIGGQFRNGVTNTSQKRKEKQGEGNFLVGIEHFQTASINNQMDTTLFHLPRLQQYQTRSIFQVLETQVGHGLVSVVTDAEFGPWCLFFKPVSSLSTPCGQQKGGPAEQSFQHCYLHQEGTASNEELQPLQPMVSQRIEAGGHLRGSSHPASCSELGQLQQVAQGHVQVAFEDLRTEMPPSLLTACAIHQIHR